MKHSVFSSHKWRGFFSGKGFYAALALCLVGAGATAWVAADRTLSGLEEQNRQLSLQSQTQLVDEEEFVWQTPQTPVQNSVSGQPKFSSPSSPESSSSSSAAPSSAPAAPSAQPAASPVQSASAFVLPVPGAVFQRFSEGKLVYSETLADWRTHNGADFAADPGTDVVAVQTGTVSAVTNDPLWGWTVEIDHGNGLSSRTCGLSEKLSVSAGEWVSVGQVIGRAASVPCESSLQPHIHLEITQNGAAVEPLQAMGKR